MLSAPRLRFDAGMSRHIVLLTDFSEAAARAYAPVAALADLLGARITLLHVVESAAVIPHGAPLAVPLPSPEASERAAEARTRLLDARNAFPSDCDVKTALATGPDIAAAVAEFARAHEADFLALASHGRSGLRRVVMGSVAEAVLRRAQTPVLVYPPSAA